MNEATVLVGTTQQALGENCTSDFKRLWRKMICMITWKKEIDAKKIGAEITAIVFFL